jgi:hypothetical protein
MDISLMCTSSEEKAPVSRSARQCSALFDFDAAVPAKRWNRWHDLRTPGGVPDSTGGKDRWKWPELEGRQRTTNSSD